MDTGQRSFVLIHGAWHGTYVWQSILPQLRALGHIATAGMPGDPHYHRIDQAGPHIGSVGDVGLPTGCGAGLLCFALFWHALDIVWIMIFTAVYLMGVVR
jgi:hypothetical protein